MRTIPLKYVARVNADVLPETTDPSYRFRYVDISQVSSTGAVDTSSNSVTFKDAPSRARRLAPEGATIVSTVRTYLRAIAQVPTSEEPLVFSTGFATLEARVGDPRFLNYTCRSTPFVEEVVARSTGVGYPAINANDMTAIEIPWPTGAEQRRIADFLDDRVARIDQIIAARQQQVRHADRARISLVDSVLTPAHPSGMTRLGRLATIQSGLTVDEKRSNASGGDCYPYLRVANVQAGGLDLAEIKTVVAEEALAKRCTLRPGDVLMTEGGDLDKLGRGTVWHGEISPCLHQNHVFSVRPARELLIADYLALYTQSSAARSYFERPGSKTTNLASTSASKVMALPIPFVPISEQRDLASECQNQLAAVDAGVTALISAVSLLQEYKQSLITAAVTGEFDVTTASTKIPE